MLAEFEGGGWDVKLAVWTLMGAVWIQIATNFFNDAIDADKGADTDARLGPVRATASGQLSRRVVYGAAVLCLLVAAVFGYLLYAERGWSIIAIGIPSLYLCYGYTGGPVPLAYRGLGELFVILFFGIVAVVGTYFVQTGKWDSHAGQIGLAVGCLSAVLISINNLRDVDEDRSNQKNTLAVKWGRRNALKLLLMMTLLPYGIAFLRLVDGAVDAVCFALPLALGVWIWGRVSSTPPSEVYNRYLALSAVQLILFAGAIYLSYLF